MSSSPSSDVIGATAADTFFISSTAATMDVGRPPVDALSPSHAEAEETVAADGSGFHPGGSSSPTTRLGERTSRGKELDEDVTVNVGVEEDFVYSLTAGDDGQELFSGPVIVKILDTGFLQMTEVANGEVVGKWPISARFLQEKAVVEFDGHDDTHHFLKGRIRSIGRLCEAMTDFLVNSDYETKDGVTDTTHGGKRDSAIDTLGAQDIGVKDKDEDVGDAQEGTAADDWWPNDLTDSGSSDDEREERGPKRKRDSATPTSRKAKKAPGDCYSWPDASEETDSETETNVCPVCADDFEDLSELIMHVAGDHQLGDDDFCCVLCGEGFHEPQNLAWHVAEHFD